ncbi:MAG: acyltransferase family protein [Lachnospiraceae bacterium]|nr:acyltransferase family protein [Lachnospiraceae bacterium]
MNSLLQLFIGVESEDRKKYIDIAKCIGIFLVIHNHLGLDYNNNVIKIIIASFHMPLFFMLSGVVKSFSNKDMAIWRMIWKKFIVIMIPYYLWSFVFIDFKPLQLLYILYGSNISISKAGGVGGSWYLPCFFIADILYEIYRRAKMKSISFPVIISLICLGIGYLLTQFKPALGFFMSFDVAFSGAGFIIIGDVLQKTRILDKIQNIKCSLKILSMICMITACGFLAINNPESYANEFNRPVMALGYYGDYILFIITSLLGTFCVLLLSILIENIRLFTFMISIGKNTLPILLVQQIIIIYVEKIIVKLPIHTNMFVALGVALVALFISHIISHVITYIVPNFKGRYVMMK